MVIVSFREPAAALCAHNGACYPVKKMRLLNCEVAMGSGYPGGDGETYYDLYLVAAGTKPQQPRGPAAPKTWADYTRQFEAAHENDPPQTSCAGMADYVTRIFFKIENGIYTPERMGTDVRTMEFQGYLSVKQARKLLFYIGLAQTGDQTPRAMGEAEYQACMAFGAGKPLPPDLAAKARQKYGAAPQFGAAGQ